MSTPVPAYSHTQKSPLWLLLFVPGVAAFVAAWFFRDQFPAPLILAGSGAVVALLALTFQQLTVEDGATGWRSGSARCRSFGEPSGTRTSSGSRSGAR
jgi:hypothetical protein